MKRPVTEKDNDTDKMAQEYYPGEQNTETTSENMQHIFSDIYRAEENGALNETAYFATEITTNQNTITTTENIEEEIKIDSISIMNKNQNMEGSENSHENKSQPDEVEE